ncbi:MAG TPA: hypothetical protein VGR11_04370, partial [Solirubrobacteraceae bacterium]|nr:hypothetical protein [Solirubrobacteraceae bacterium]
LVRDDVETAVVPRSDAQTEAVARRGRAVTREDARRLRFELPADEPADDEPPLRPGEIPASRDDG